MPAILTTPPAVEPVTLAEAKAHLRVGHADEDAFISNLISAARRHIEALTGLCFITQTWSCYRDCWPDAPAVDLLLSPVQSVATVNIYGEDDVAAPLDAAHYVLDAASRPARLALRPSRIWPLPGRATNGIEIVLIAGFGAAGSDVPQPLRQAILQLTAHWYSHRGETSAPLPLDVMPLIAPFREVRL